MNPSRPVLTPDAAAGLTRLVLGYCLGRGSISLYSRSYVLQIHHTLPTMEYAFYQWRRVRQFLPAVKPPVHFAVRNNERGDGAQWRLRISSRWFETAWRLLYGQDGFRVTSPVLELLGAEAIGSLWADRGQVLLTKRANYCNGRLNLSRYDWESAQMVHDWIQTLTGAAGRLHHGPRSADAPMIFYDDEATQAILDAIDRTWMAKAPCLARKFRRPQTFLQKRRENERERLQAEMMMPQVDGRRARRTLLQKRGRRLAPAMPAPALPAMPGPAVLVGRSAEAADDGSGITGEATPG